MRKLSKGSVLILGAMVAAIAAPSAASAKCWTYYAKKTRHSEHKARQAAIIAVNTKWNSEKAAHVAQYGNATNMNGWIAAHRRILPIHLSCHRSSGRYTCRASKNICTK